MKTKAFAVVISGTAVAVLCLAGAGFLQTSQAQTDSAPPPAPDDSTAAAATEEPAALPPSIDANGPLGQVIKLVQSGVSEDVVMAYVTNSTSVFNLDPDKIIYLKDVGAPDELVTAMMQRDQALQGQTAAATYQPPAPAAPVTETVAPAPSPAVTVVEQAAPVTVDYFYTSLAPYGSWVYVAGYGRCWRPTVAVAYGGWQPYCDHGHWVWTDCGWYWISDYSWGWAPFHYGRWFCDARLGWCWYPDTVWGPSWVTWRYSSDYCGWAPLPPHAVYRAGVGFFYNGSAVSVGFSFGLGVNAYTFVPTRNFCDPRPWHYRVEPRELPRIYNQTTIINNFGEDNHNRRFINHGIDPGRITQVTHSEIRPVTIHETTGHVARGEQLGRDGHTLYINRPRFSDNPTPSNQGPGARRASPPPVGSAYQGQGPRNGGQNNRPSQPGNYRPVPTTTPSANQGAASRPTPTPPVGSAYQGSGPQAGNQNNRPFSPRNGQTAPTTLPSGQRPYPPAATYNPPGRSPTTTSTQPAPAPVFNRAPVPPERPLPPGFNSADSQRYVSPRMQQNEQPKPRTGPDYGGRAGATFPAPAAPVQPAAPPQPPQRSYVSPRSEPAPGGSRANYSQPPPAGGQTHGAPSPSAPPAQSHGSGGNKNQNGQ